MAREKKRRTEGKKVEDVSRRDFIKAAGAGLAVAGVGASIIIPGSAGAGKKQLRIVQWIHPNPHFDDWFNTYAKEWGEKNNTVVIVENHP